MDESVWERLANTRIEAAREKAAEGETAPGQQESLARPTRLPLTAQRAATLVDKQVEKAMEDGLFDNLPGAGKPIDLYDDMYVPEDMKMAYRLMKGQNAVPPWIELQKDWQRQDEAYRTWFSSLRSRWPRLNAAEREKFQAELKRRVNELNNTIYSLNTSVPTDRLSKGLLVYERELRALDPQDS